MHSSNGQEQKEVRLLQTLPTELPSRQEDPAAPVHRCCYDSFAFRDRITNNRFQYREAHYTPHPRLKFLEWTSSDSPFTSELKTSIKVYKFAKNFQIDCIRSTYIRQPHRESSSQQALPRRPTAGEAERRLTREALFQINKQEMKRVLESNGSVSAEVLRLNRNGYCPPRQPCATASKKSLLKWQVLDNNLKENAPESEMERRLTDNITNHMKNHIRANCEYLLTMPPQQKKKALFQAQLNRYRHSRKPPFPRQQHPEIESCRFTPLQQQRNKLDGALRVEDIGDEEKRVVQLVRCGFINELYLQLQENPHLCGSRDEIGNNIFHLAAKEGNAEMITQLLKVVSPRQCLILLCGTNNLKRTPAQKAAMLGYRQVARMLENHLKELRDKI